MRVLIVDDDPEVRDILAMALVEWGYDCETAGDTDRALELLQRQPFAIMLLDMLMPSMPGPEFLSWLHAVLAPDQMPRVIVVTGYVPTGPPGETDLADDEAVERILHKPFALHELLSAVQAAAETTRGAARTP